MKVKHVYLTANEPASLADYYQKIGLPIRFVDGERWIQFHSDGAAFCVAGPGESPAPPSSNAVVVFEVERLEDVLERAIEAGAAVVAPIRDMGRHGRVAWICDPESNVVQFFEPPDKPNSQET
jgi:predicted enzyme related to lactoylglutathione lyase